MLRTSGLRANYIRIAVQPAANALLRMGVGSYLVSVIGAASAIGACMVLAYDPFWGGFLVIAAGYVDNLDGQMARTTGKEGPAGAFLDSVLDRYSDFLFVFGILLHYYRSNALDFTGVLIFFWLAFGTLIGNYEQARAEGLSDSCSVGFWERPEMVIFLGLAGIMNGLIRIDLGLEIPLLRPGAILGVSLVVLAVGTNWMALRRLFYGFNKMRRKSPGPPELSSTHP
jgi:CDP-diacylglycerol--glycerol-3-phosphate 3-phosphatidyltransferase